MATASIMSRLAVEIVLLQKDDHGLHAWRAPQATQTTSCDVCHAPDKWRILIVDDDEDVHVATTTALDGEVILGRELAFEHAYSGAQACEVLARDRDFAVILLDVVMERPHVGLETVAKIRNDFDMKLSRILLRTGQPGHAPELEVIRSLDINDYLYKSNTSAQRLLVSLTSAIKAYSQMEQLERTSRGMARILDCANDLLEAHRVEPFVDTMIAYSERVFGQGTSMAVAYAGKTSRYGDVDLTVLGATSQWAHLVPTPDHTDHERFYAELEKEKAFQILQQAYTTESSVDDECWMACFIRLEPTRNVLVALQFKSKPDATTQLIVRHFVNTVKICAKRLAMLRERMRQSMISMGILAHEFRTPIAALMMDVQTVDDLVQASAPSNAKRMTKVLGHAQTLIEAMNAHIDRSMENFGVVFKEDYLLPTSNVDVCGLIKQLVETHQTLFHAVGVPALVMPEHMYAVADRETLEQALLNLLSNAIKAVLRRDEIIQPAISIRVEQLRDQAAIYVTDKGCGMTPAEAKSAFEPFVSSSVEPSHGLGLTMVKKVIQAMKGEVTVESEVGVGTTFKIVLWLPR